MSRSHILRISSNYLSGNTATQTPEERLTSKLKHLGGNGYWAEPHNVVVNFSLQGANLWAFSILPMSWQRMGHPADLGGIVIKPSWSPVGKGNALGISGSDGYHKLTDTWVDAILKGIPQVRTIQDSVQLDLMKLERHFQIEIPVGIKTKIIGDSLATAKRRWGANMLKTKARLIPLDGSPSRDLSV